MKTTVQIVALTFVIAAAVTSISPSRTPAMASNIHSFGPPGPTPTCNPFIQTCPVIR